jgi:hypothetical protein
MPVDPQLLADDLCELLHRRDNVVAERDLAMLLLDSTEVVDEALCELAQRGLLGQLLREQQLSSEGVLLAALRDCVQSNKSRLLICHELLPRKDETACLAVEQLIVHAGQDLPSLFGLLIAHGNYEPLRKLLTANGRHDTPALRALAGARPDYGKDTLNQATIDHLLSEGRAATPYDLLIVPGFTPIEVTRPTPLRELPAAQSRVALAATDMRAGCARAVLVSGGSVHPPGTPYNEALMMRERLLELGIPSKQILIDPHARHSTTNLRNAGRIMRSLGMTRGLIVTGFDRAVMSQAFYFAHSLLSTFQLRCQQDLGYSVGELREIDEHHIAYTPSQEVTTPSYDDPLDV